MTKEGLHMKNYGRRKDYRWTQRRSCGRFMDYRWSRENYDTLHIRSQIKQPPTFSNGFTLESANQRGKIGRFGFGGRISNRHIPLKTTIAGLLGYSLQLLGWSCHQIARDGSFNLCTCTSLIYIGICYVFTWSSTFLLSPDSFICDPVCHILSLKRWSLFLKNSRYILFAFHHPQSQIDGYGPS